MKTFEKLENRYIFTGVLVLTEAMHIGSGESDEHADSTFVKSKFNPNGEPIFYIPGSSLRGALRSTVERITYSLAPDGQADKISCLLNKEGNSTCISVCKNTLYDYTDLIERPEAGEAELKAFLEKDGNLCDTCKIFGSTHFASKLKITDLYPSRNNNPRDIIRHRVGIDRDTETASEGALFEIEVLEKDCKFDFELIAENLEGETEWGLLCIGLQEMMRKKEEGGAFYIGADSAIGLGRCQLTNLDIKYFDQQDATYNLKKYLVENQLGRKVGSDAVKFVCDKVNAYPYEGGE
jgi:CRISPR-associated RAMP protein (TIGR02581 family)